METDLKPDENEIITISSEFSVVSVQKVQTRNGERLEIVAPKLGYRIRLDSIVLESLTWQKPETFSKFLENSWAPSKPNGGSIEE